MGVKGKPQNVAHRGFRGVRPRRLKDGEMRYRAALYYNGKTKWGPARLTQREAAKDHDRMAIEFFKGEAILNFPSGG